MKVGISYEMHLVPQPCGDLSSWSKGDVELRMRWMLFNWLLDVASPDAMDLNDSCLLLCFRLIDRYIHVQNFEKKHLHILGMASLFLAVKMHGDDIPRARDFIYYLDDTHYVVDHLVAMEKKILQALDFTFFTPGEEDRRYNPFDTKSESGALFDYLWDLALIDYRMNDFDLSTIRAAAEQICQQLHGGGTTATTSNDAYARFLEVIYDEKLRIESGKRTAVQRKHTRKPEGMSTINALFEQLSKLKQHLASEEHKKHHGKRKRESSSASPPPTANKMVKTRCIEKTKRGKRCKLSAVAGCDFCSKHVKL